LNGKNRKALARDTLARIRLCIKMTNKLSKATNIPPMIEISFTKSSATKRNKKTGGL